jgi:hypothetical protein
MVRLAGAAALTLGVSVAMGLPAAQAKGGSGTESHGSCSATSTYKLNVNEKKGSIVIKAKVNGGVANETWTYSIADNGTTVVADEATTDSNGKFKVKQSIPNLDGTDTVDFSAVDTVTGESCTAEVVVD